MLTTRFAARLGASATRRLGATYTQARSLNVFSSERLVGKNILVTGASSGIGASTAELFAKAGSNVVLLARRRANLDEVKAKCEATHAEAGYAGSKVVVIEADMQDRKALDTVLDKTEGLKLDVLVNNAGLVRGREHVGAEADIDVMFNTNVIGLIQLTQNVVRDFKKRNTGLIVNLGSVAGIESYPGGSIYCATKFAVHAFTDSLRHELIDTNVRIAEILPGMVETEFSVVRYRGDQGRADNEYKGITPLTGADVAEQIVWVASRPEHVQVANILMFPSQQSAATRNWRRPE
ncbi:NADP-dependent 3-hydroxy acid dehydrogenase [Vanrija pseudolonga]|uniref:NADP-dependent 3-hydroxy acid dehydrogenase n=1 Tax=Vanrija pseudolonga TaxID=143232 RepID=A0AAF0YA79_9TREE|nr:NADP-dependent 3-hydroxy acid dehydrogenase [Vanrija pseudolonga]